MRKIILTKRDLKIIGENKEFLKITEKIIALASEELNKSCDDAFIIGKDAALDGWEDWILDCMRREKDWIPFEIMLKQIKIWRKNK